MFIVSTIKEMSEISEKLRRENKTIGFVPTMGALHAGHLSLCYKSIQLTDVTIASIFVNPTQFAPNEDFNKYPRNIEQDSILAEQHGIDYIFAPSPEEMYSENFSTNILVAGISGILEGEKRPGHFNGVALIVAKLFNIINPDCVFFGQKDYQQALVIKKMASELNFRVKIIVEPTVRLENGLAMSSRNIYLSETEKNNASIIYKAMLEAKLAVNNGLRERKKINNILVNKLSEVKGLKIDYAISALDDDLAEPDVFQENDKIVILVAAYVGNTRLIDNMLI